MFTSFFTVGNSNVNKLKFYFHFRSTTCSLHFLLLHLAPSPTGMGVEGRVGMGV